MRLSPREHGHASDMLDLLVTGAHMVPVDALIESIKEQIAEHALTDPALKRPPVNEAQRQRRLENQQEHQRLMAYLEARLRTAEALREFRDATDALKRIERS